MPRKRAEWYDVSREVAAFARATVDNGAEPTYAGPILRSKAAAFRHAFYRWRMQAIDAARTTSPGEFFQQFATVLGVGPEAAYRYFQEVKSIMVSLEPRRAERVYVVGTVVHIEVGNKPILTIAQTVPPVMKVNEKLLSSLSSNEERNSEQEEAERREEELRQELLSNLESPED